MQEEIVFIGRVTRFHGRYGEVRVWPLTDDPRRFSRLKEVFIVGRPSRHTQPYQVERARYHKNFVLLKLAGCNSIDDAQKLTGAYVGILPQQLVELPEGSYFYYQLVGLRVYTDTGEYLGRVSYIFSTGSNDVYVVRRGEKEYLVPAIKDVVRRIDLENKRMVLRVLEGLF